MIHLNVTRCLFARRMSFKEMGIYICAGVEFRLSGSFGCATQSVPTYRFADKEMDGWRCSWKPDEVPGPVLTLVHSPVTDRSIPGRWDG